MTLGTFKIKVSELFYSIQGEGRYMGVPSVFLRTFGCNFTCSGFGMPAGERSIEADKIATSAHMYARYDELPLVESGCDSYGAWHPKFKHLSPTLPTGSVVNQIVALLPLGRWHDEHLVITGGEPLLGWQRAYPELLSNHKMADLKELTFETNGTQELSDTFIEYLEEWTRERSKEALTFSVSPKLSCSGEAASEALQADIIAQYQRYGHTYLKFVVATETDVAEAMLATEYYRKKGFTGSVYLMPVGGVESVYTLNNRRVAEAALEAGVRYSDRLQVVLWKNAWGT